MRRCAHESKIQPSEFSVRHSKFCFLLSHSYMLLSVTSSTNTMTTCPNLPGKLLICPKQCPPTPWYVACDYHLISIWNLFVYFFKFIFLRGWREAERNGEREPQAGSTLSVEPNAGLELRTTRSQSEPISRVRHLTYGASQAPWNLFFNSQKRIFSCSGF